LVRKVESVFAGIAAERQQAQLEAVRVERPQVGEHDLADATDLEAVDDVENPDHAVRPRSRQTVANVLR
jgi:hypothetical protein